MAIILGIDPGSRVTGYGIIEVNGQDSKMLTCGTISVGSGDMSQRLFLIYTGLQKVIQTYAPTEGAIEEVFSHLNPAGALTLGQARGVALLALAQANLNVIAEYTARRVKQVVVGYGAASKIQVQFMVQTLLKEKPLTEMDATDALAVALCHAHSRLLPSIVRTNTNKKRSRRWTQISLERLKQ